MKERILHESGSNNYTNQDELPAAYLSHKEVANVVTRGAKN